SNVGFFCSLLAPSDAILFQEGVSVKLRLPHHYGTSYLDSNICEHAICPVVMGLNVCSLMEGKRAAQI
ncbi:hypothetical protein, partial [Escherichia coli]|uniref:hypothetical protein n=1 Tax=Escherichia coli TaxID=562 RepID=UPI001BFEA0C3